MNTKSFQVLHVGCGAKTIEHMPEGFRDGRWQELRFDIDPNARPDFVGTITDMSAVQDGSVDAVYSSHSLEHVYSHEVPGVLREFRRVLKPEGFLVVTCPDLQSLGEAITAGRLEEPLYESSGGPITPLDMIYGHLASLAEGAHYMAHKTGFSRDTLQRHAREAGFAGLAVRRWSAKHELWLIAYREPATKDALMATMKLYGPAMPVFEAAPA
jgi:SAM-dependent methyltransferase